MEHLARLNSSCTSILYPLPTLEGRLALQTQQKPRPTTSVSSKMPPSESRQITRPRTSLSCLICRRRKVRCGREQPACNNCVKMNEACEYEKDMPDRAALQAERNQSYQAHHSEPGTESSEPSSDPSATTDNTSSSASTFYQNPSSSTSSLLFSQPAQGPPHGLAHAFANTPQSWIPGGREGQNPQQPAQASSRKRPRTPVGFIPQRQEQPADIATPMLDSPLSHSSVRENTRATTYAASDGGDGHEDIHAIDSSGYLNVRSGGQVRYVGGAFWGLVKGHVSKALSWSLF